MTLDEYWFWLSNITELNYGDIKRLLGFFGGAEQIFNASFNELKNSKTVTDEIASLIVKSRNNLRVMYKLEKLRSEGISFIHYESENYPEYFLNLSDYPLSFYVKGKMPEFDLPSAGIVGSRVCSGYGKEMTIKYAQTLAINGIQIISGLAMGVDSYASRGALEVGGKTFAVLGSGIDVIYPAQNIELYYQIALSGGGIISEYPPGTKPVGWQFPHRNRLISALSNVLLVIEAKKRSGTLTTVAHALSQGKEIYALPGRVTDSLSEGCNRLIADGAGVLLSPEDLLRDFFGIICETPNVLEPESISPELMIKKEMPHTFKAEKVIKQPEPELKGVLGLVYAHTNADAKTVQAIAEEAGLNAAEASKALVELELTGLISEVSKDYYARA